MILTSLTKITRIERDMSPKFVLMRFTVQFSSCNGRSESELADDFIVSPLPVRAYFPDVVKKYVFHVVKEHGLVNVTVTDVPDPNNRAIIAFMLGLKTGRAACVVDADDNFSSNYPLSVRLELTPKNGVELLFAYKSAFEHNLWHTKEPLITDHAENVVIYYDVYAKSLANLAQWGHSLGHISSVVDLQLQLITK